MALTSTPPTTSYWGDHVHNNDIVSSTLHQVMKYVDKDGWMQTLITKKHTFKSVKNYFTDFLLYWDSLEADPQPEEPNSNDEADQSLRWVCMGVDYFVIGTSKDNVINTVDIDVKLYINEYAELAYLSPCPSEYVPFDNDIDIDDGDDVIST